MKKVTLIHGDITEISVDALVNSANKSLLGGGGLDYIIHKKAGPLLKEACIKLNKTKGGCRTGNAEITIAGALPAKYLIHAVGPRWLNGEKGEPQLLCDTYSNALKRAEEIKAKTVSFPNIATGVYSFPRKMAAEIAIGTVLSELPYYSEIEHVFFVCKDELNLEIYKQILKQVEDPKIEILI
ncbi:macro domain-containing protein [Acinetobacter sp. GXMZU3951]|jgi:O-acetyl-ADP-ribose deacetylase (regulator of RNase III)